MESPYPRFRGKRNFSFYDHEYGDYNGRLKRYFQEESQNGQSLTPPTSFPKTTQNETVFRIICPESRAGSVIGKGGSIIKSLRQETGAKIMIADAAQGADDRVIFISSPDRDHHGMSNKDTSDPDKDVENTEYNNDEKEMLSPAQEALFKVHEQIIDGGDLKGEVDENTSHDIITRLLVPSSQVGCLLGKGGKIIEQMREDTKARIRILPRDQLQLSSLPFDEILQIVGDADAVKKAIRLVAKRLQENPAHEQINFSSLVPPRGSVTGPLSQDPGDFIRNTLNANRNIDLYHQKHPLGFPDMETHISHGPLTCTADGGYPGRAPKDGLIFRILCPNEKIGGIIGKGGSIIRGLQEEIGVRIKVMDPVVGSNERVIAIFSTEHPSDDISPAQEALLHVQSKIADFGNDEDAVTTSRLLVPSDQVGCLLGKGGSIITEIRRSTRANIRILGKDDLPKCAPPTDELVQIVGDIRVSRDALIQVTERLRSKCRQERLLVNPGESINTAFLRSMAPRRQDFGLPGKLDFPRSGVQSLGPQNPNFQAVLTSPGHWSGQETNGFRQLRDYEAPQNQQIPDFRFAVPMVTRTTVQVMIPAHAVSSIIGDGGSKIVRIRQISGAKVDLLDFGCGTSEGAVKISGSPEQTETAQSLLQDLIFNTQSQHISYTG